MYANGHMTGNAYNRMAAYSYHILKLRILAELTLIIE